MINFRNEFLDILDSNIASPNPLLSLSNKQIILYGAGKLGKMALSLLKLKNLKPQYIVDMNLKGTIEGIPIISPSEIAINDKENSLFLVCISSIPYQPIYDYLKNMDCKDVRQFYDFSEIVFPEILNNGWYKFNLTNKEKHEVINLSEYLSHDECSTSHYLQFLWWRIRRKESISEEFPVLTEHKYFDSPCFPVLTNEESFLDVGAHHGSAVDHFIKKVCKMFNKIWAFEPDELNLSKFKKNISKDMIEKISLYNIAISNINKNSLFADKLGFASKLEEQGNSFVSVKTIDTLKLKPSIIKLHIEGYELQALEGACETIENYRPILMVLADHNDDGLFKIGKFLSKLENYRLYFYLHDYCGNSAIFYAIPEERY